MIYFGKVSWGLTHQNPCLFFQLLHEFLFLLNSQSYRTTTYKKKHAMHCRLHVKCPTALPVKQKHTNLKNRWYIVTHVSYDSWMVFRTTNKDNIHIFLPWKMNVANYSGIKKLLNTLVKYIKRQHLKWWKSIESKVVDNLFIVE